MLSRLLGRQAGETSGLCRTAQGTDQVMAQFNFHCFCQLCSFSAARSEQAPRHVISGCRHWF